jgi:hypothetical protein
VCVAPYHVADVWPAVAHHIAASLRRGGLGDVQHVARKVFAGDALLWLAWDGRAIMAAAVTELGAVNGRRICTIVACGGRDRARWQPLIAALEEYARSEDCAATRILGRKGWARVLPDYRNIAIVLEKELA